MSSTAIGFAGIAAMMVLLAMRVPVAIALVAVSWVGLWTLLDVGAAWGILQSVPREFTASWTLSSVPMFLLMGYVCFYTGVTNSLFDLSKALLYKLPGSIAISSVLACSAFAAVCGSSVACAAAMGRIAIPEMVRGGYDKNFACGSVAAGGTIGALIPPSILMIIYGVVTQTSVVQLFLGGIGIGLVTSLSYILVILLMSWRRPDKVPRSQPKPPAVSLRASLIEMLPIIALIFCVFGGLLGGFFTATEAGAIGASASIAIAIFMKRMSFYIFARSVSETVMTCAGLFIIAVGAMMLTRFLSISGTGDFISALVTSWALTPWQLMLLITAIYLVLGMFMDPFGAMLLTLPIFIPIVGEAGLDLVWFGVLVIKLLETGMISPPFGLNVFVIKGVVGNLTSLAGIFRGAMIFIVVDVVIVVLAIVFPAIITFFPSLMSGR